MMCYAVPDKTGLRNYVNAFSTIPCLPCYVCSMKMAHYVRAPKMYKRDETYNFRIILNRVCFGSVTSGSRI